MIITVTNDADSGAGTLRAALSAAADGDEIQFDPLVTLITLTSAELSKSLGVLESLTITGPGSNLLTISGGGTKRVFNFIQGTFTMTGITIANGAGALGAGIHNEARLILQDIVISGCTSSDDGGGIWNSSSVSATDVSIGNCSASAGDGGAIWNSGTIGSLISVGLIDCHISINQASGSGGGIYNEGTVDMDGGVITGCTAFGINGGGGIWNNGSFGSDPAKGLIEVTISDNSATSGNGDGINNSFGTVNIFRCAIYDNNELGVSNASGTVNIDNSTVSGHTGTNVDNYLGALDIKRSTITLGLYGVGNAEPGSVFTFSNTILAGNTFDYSSFAADITSEGNNIYGTFDIDPVTPAAGDITIMDFAGLVLGPLQNNGGPTYTHAVLEGSPAIDAGDATGAPTTDQRGVGFARVIDGAMDIGAFESDIEPQPPEPPQPPTPTPTPEPSPFPQPEPAPAPSVPPDVRTCPIPASPCTRPEEPIINSSSESPDTVDFFSGMNYGFGDWDPPLNKGFVTAVGCGVTCTAPTQEEADLCAQRIANSCTEDSNPEPDPSERFPTGGGGNPFPPIDPQVPTVIPTLYGNEAYTAYTTCSDGTQSSYTVAAGTFTNLTQAGANQMAHNFGDKVVIERRWCINPITPLHCTNQPIDGFFSATGYNPQIPKQQYPLELLTVPASIPPGITFTQFEPGIWTATGSPSQAGFYTFTVRITNGDGTTKQSTMSMLIWGITTLTLPDPQLDVPYSQQIMSSGAMQSVTYSVTSGTLPPGLTLSASGLLSGTPTDGGTFFFIIQASATDPVGSGTCSKEYTLEVDDAACPNLLTSFSVTDVDRALGGVYGTTEGWTYLMCESSITGWLEIHAYDGNDVEQAMSDYPGYFAFQGGGVTYSALHNRLYATADIDSVSDVTLKVINASTLVDLGDVDLTPFLSTGSVGIPVYIPQLDVVVISTDVNIAMVDASTNTVSHSAAGGCSNNGVAYSPVSGNIYCPITLFPADAAVVVRDSTLALLSTITLTGCDVSKAPALLAQGKIIVPAMTEPGALAVIFVIDPASETVTNMVTSSVGTALGGPWAANYDPSTNLIYITVGNNPGTIIVFNPSTESIVCEIPATFVDFGRNQIPVNTDSEQFYILLGGLAGAVEKYGQP